MIDLENDISSTQDDLLTPDDVPDAVSITEATRALIDQVAVWALQAQALTVTNMPADVASLAMAPTALLPVVCELKFSGDGDDVRHSAVNSLDPKSP